MVALAILSLSLVVLLRGVSLSVTAFDYTRQLTTAQMLARDKMTEIELSCDEPDDEKSEHGDFGDDYPDYEWRYEYELVDFGELIPQEVNIGFDLYRLRLTVSWKNGTAERDYELIKVVGVPK